LSEISNSKIPCHLIPESARRFLSVTDSGFSLIDSGVASEGKTAKKSPQVKLQHHQEEIKFNL
jgi:hypothetical protein